MTEHLSQWLNLALRWAHVITGVAWIGTSFYFNWLNSRIAPPDRPEAGVAGELWSVHGGGFYRVVKYTVAPTHLPQTLHWFRWEAYATWLTGFALLVQVYYVGAAAYLIDPRVARLGTGEAIAVGVITLIVAWLVYDALCKSPLAARPLLLGGLLVALGAALAWGLAQLLSPRAAYLHVGSAIGTIMVGNVAHVIIPSQRDMVAAVAAGRAPDATRGSQAALRSLHNNYFTLPVLFIMVSAHYPATYGHQWNWLILAGLTLVGVAARHWFNLRNQGRPNAWLLPSAALGILALAAVTRPRTTGTAGAAEAGVAIDAPFAKVRVVIAQRCAPCHSAGPTDPSFVAAPAGLVLDTPAQIQAAAPRVYDVAVAAQTMPMGNLTGMTQEERDLLGRWIQAGARTR